MDALTLQLFVSLALLVGALLLLAYSLKQRDPEHADRLALFPLDDEERPREPDSRGSQDGPPSSP